MMTSTPMTNEPAVTKKGEDGDEGDDVEEFLGKLHDAQDRRRGRLFNRAESGPGAERHVHACQQVFHWLDDYPWHYATQEKLAEEIGLGARQVRRSIQQLKLIEVKRMKPWRQDSLGNRMYGPTAINHYRICREHLHGLLAALREERCEQRLAATAVSWTSSPPVARNNPNHLHA